MKTSCVDKIDNQQDPKKCAKQTKSAKVGLLLLPANSDHLKIQFCF